MYYTILYYTILTMLCYAMLILCYATIKSTRLVQASG